MRKKNCFAFSPSRGLSEKFVACLTCCCLNGHLFLLCELANVYGIEFKIDKHVSRCRPLAVAINQFLDKARVSVAGSSAQLMIQMANDQFLVTEIDQPM